MRAYVLWWLSTKTGWSLTEIREADPALIADLMETDHRMSRAARARQEREQKK
jgi:hypothetical protein